MTTGIVARLGSRRSGSKESAAYAASYRVFCGRQIDGRPVCGRVLGRILGSDGDGQIDDLVITFFPSWVEGEDGVWRLSRHAKKTQAHASDRQQSG